MYLYLFYYNNIYYCNYINIYLYLFYYSIIYIYIYIYICICIYIYCYLYILYSFHCYRLLVAMTYNSILPYQYTLILI